MILTDEECHIIHAKWLQDPEATGTTLQRITEAAALAKLTEGVEPVACIVETEQGSMIWLIEDYNEASTYCDIEEFPMKLYPAYAIIEDREDYLAKCAELEIVHEMLDAEQARVRELVEELSRLGR